ncbi:MAG: GNAT family N-acetyltransferase [Christensenellaceae bacterium]|nr:GNAT family N-acetyltransferase [Christensenellaceae bacterium]
MLTLKSVDFDSPELSALAALMERAFPANERMPMNVLLSREGSEMLAILEDGAFRGFISLLTRMDICHILFFAMEEDCRGRGLGTAALELVRERKPGLRLIADLEAPDSAAPNAEQRLSRRRFYERCGYEDTGVTYRWRGEHYAILSSGGRVTDEEFWRFWNEW